MLFLGSVQQCSNLKTLLSSCRIWDCQLKPCDIVGKVASLGGELRLCSSRTCGVSHFNKVDEKLEFCMSTYSKGTTKGIMHLP
jgi:hypothetical protein